MSSCTRTESIFQRRERERLVVFVVLHVKRICKFPAQGKNFFLKKSPKCIPKGDRSLEEHLKEFLILAYLSHFPDDYLCSFLLAGINTSTKAQLSGQGPRGSFKAFLEWLLISCGLPFTVRPVAPAPLPTRCPARNRRAAACALRREPASTTMHEPELLGTTEQDIAPEHEPRVSDKMCEPAASQPMGFREESEGAEWRSAHTPATETSTPVLSHSCHPVFTVSHPPPEATPCVCCEPVSPGPGDPLAPPLASDPVVPPRPFTLTPPPSLLPLSTPAVTSIGATWVEHYLNNALRAVNCSPALHPMALFGSALLQDPPQPSVAPAPP
ncbi:histone-lysine N-methyltransferase 2D-like isoform X2 [Ctenopharyngodon idella]|uniref:histone-lysine N-methyltransferase 2D-like isoform X2 n=1 Tax=Ctenopharyngodon idella TaxID=7959 RepID=UPI00223153F7|nr:histone-lysine N-methyltransferase 2D-like isoform X2 [Ctenopharyngodon idella]